MTDELPPAVMLRRMTTAITAERYAQGMTFDAYVASIGTPEHLQRTGNRGPRRDLSARYREDFERSRPTEEQIWASATVDEIVCGLHRRLVLGAV